MPEQVPGQPVVTSKPLSYWTEQIDLAKAAQTPYDGWAEQNLHEYSPQPSRDPKAYALEINTNRDFTLVERKKADLFYQKPDVSLQPTPLMDAPIPSGQVDPMSGASIPMLDGKGQPILGTVALQAHEEIVNEKLGPDGVHATRMVHATLFDVLCTLGTGWTKMGFESFSVPVKQMDPLTGLERTVQVPIHQRCFWEHFSPKQRRIPHNFRSTDWDRAPWLGMAFELPLTPGNREKYQLPDDFRGSQAKHELYFDHGTNQTQATQDVFTGTEIWYRSALFREDVQHPDHLTQLVIVDGIDHPVIEQDSPYQTLTPRGDLTPDSLIGFPIHPLNTRTLTDSNNPASDSTMIRSLVNELNTFRTQMVEYRDACGLRWVYNTDVLPKDAFGEIARSRIGGAVGLPGDAFHGEGAIKELPQGSMPRESFTSNDYIDNDIARTSAVDAAGAGVQATSSTTATESQIVAANANARLDFERGVVLQWYVKGVTKFSTLLQRYLPVEHAAQIVGPERAQIWDAWRKTVPSTLAFTALPDSALAVDQAVDRKAAQDLYSFLANDPFVNRKALLSSLLRKFHLNPDKIVQDPPPPQPDQSKTSLSFKGEDLVAPQAPVVIEILMQQGFKISPGAILQSQQALLQAQQLAAAEAAEAEAKKGNDKHGGKVAQQESLSKHAADATGAMQNTGAPAPLGAGGGMIQ